MLNYIKTTHNLSLNNEFNELAKKLSIDSLHNLGLNSLLDEMIKKGMIIKETRVVQISVEHFDNTFTFEKVPKCPPLFLHVKCIL